jgi:hypothetical protein
MIAFQDWYFNDMGLKIGINIPFFYFDYKNA